VIQNPNLLARSFFSSQISGVENHRCRRECVRFFLESNRSRVLRACFEAFVERNGDISVRDGVLKTHFVQFSSTASTHYLWGFFPEKKKSRVLPRARVTRGDVFRADVVDESRY
jgi:hypothetical protein